MTLLACRATTAAALLAATMLLACGSADAPIRIGLAGPFSEPRGESMRLAAEMAVGEINAAGGIDGRPLQLVIQDDSASADAAVRVAQKLYDTPDLVAVIGHLTSGSTLAAAPIYNGGEHPVAQITPSASSPEVSHAGPYTFRVCPTDLAHGAELAEWARRDLRVGRVAVLYHNDEYGRGVRAAFSERFRGLGGVVTTQDPYLPASESLEPYFRRMLATGNADAVMIAGSRREAERILAEMVSLGLHLPVLGADGLSGIERPDGWSTPVYLSAAYVPDQVGAVNARFVEAYGQAYPGRLPDHRGAGTYDIVHLLARTIAAAGTDRDAIREYLAGVGRTSEPFDGVTGPIEFDEQGDVRNAAIAVREAAL